MKTPLTLTTRGAATALIDSNCHLVAVGAPPCSNGDLEEIMRRVNAYDDLVAQRDALARVCESANILFTHLGDYYDDVLQYHTETDTLRENAIDAVGAALALVKESQ